MYFYVSAFITDLYSNMYIWPYIIASPHKGRKISFEKSLGDYSIRLDSFGRAQVIEECQAFIGIITSSSNGQVNGQSEKSQAYGRINGHQPEKVAKSADHGQINGHQPEKAAKSAAYGQINGHQPEKATKTSSTKPVR